MTFHRVCRRLLPALAAAAALLLAPTTAGAQSGRVGAWTQPPNLGLVPIHMHLMPSGKVMMWGGSGVPHVWDPAAPGAAVALTAAPYNVFCSGHAFLPDGRLLVAGGHISNFEGFAHASIYDPAGNTWTAAPDMNAGRWYPTVTTLANGDALVVSGDISIASGTNPLPQVYQAATHTWRDLTGAQRKQDLYPLMFLAPNGQVVEVGPTPQTRYLDTSGTGAWTRLPDRTFSGWRDYGSAVMYADGKILTMGGSDPPTRTAETLDLNAPAPAWQATGTMRTARRQLNATVLPDGTVLVTGGTSGSGFNNTATPVFGAELWNPATGAWTAMASATVPRLYHSAALLLPDGRVLTTGGDGYSDPEVYSPPYLFKGGARPAITSAPLAIAWGQSFTVRTTSSTAISKVTLVRLGSVTHAFDQNQRLNVLPFSATGEGLRITPPASGNHAPPGHYMLFVVDGNGVPSVARMVTLGATADAPDPGPGLAVTQLTPGSAVAGGPAFDLLVDGTGFTTTSTVHWNGTPRTSSLVAPNRLTAAIAAADIATAGTAQVTVANPASGSQPASESPPMPFTITAPAQATRRLSVTRDGSAAARGTVTSSPPGISCGKTCTAQFAGEKPTVTLTVAITGNSLFAGWGGACSGTLATCTVTLDRDLSVTATINRR